MPKLDPISGNVTPERSRRSFPRPSKSTVEITVETRTEDILVLPLTIHMPNGTAQPVQRVYGCQRDPAYGGAMRYSVRVGGRTRVLWRQDDGAWFAEAGKGIK